MIEPKVSPGAESVAAHYDDLDRWYRAVWGEDLHHGLWLQGTRSVKDATRNLIDRMADRLAIEKGHRVCDAGCGYGGTARVLAEAYGAHVVAVTLSERQYRFAQDKQSFGGTVEYVHGDFLANDLADGSFDTVVSIESSEHMPDKARFFSESFRILRPGGRIGVFAWLATASPRKWETRRILEPICREGQLPGMGSVADYRRFLSDAGFRDITFEDYTKQVRKTWPVVARRMVRRLWWDRRAWAFLLRGPESRVFARTVFRIWAAYRLGSMRYGLFTAIKPE